MVSPTQNAESNIAHSPARKSLLRRIYDWVLSWANTPYATWALFALAFAESSVFPIPRDVLLIALCVAMPKRSWFYALICTVGSVAGGIFGYGIGVFAEQTIASPILNLYDPNRVVFAHVQQMYSEWGFWGVLAAAITPIPYKVFTIASGLLSFNFPLFVAASVLGRGFRFFLVAGLLRYGGERLKIFIDKYFDLLAIIALVAVVLGFLLLSYI